MLVINADDWGGWKQATDAAWACYKEGRVTSLSAMVFMDDSERAAEFGKSVEVNIGLHLNLTQAFSRGNLPTTLVKNQEQIRHFLTWNRYALLLYHPLLWKEFHYLYKSQVDEFLRLYGRHPSHIDGHQHMHLCTNMLLDHVIPAGERVRRNFSFWPGEKSIVNRRYRGVVDRWLARHYHTTDFFFCLAQCLRHERLSRVLDLAKTANVELMTHPEKADEYTFLMSDRFKELIHDLRTDRYAMTQAS